MGNKRGGLVFGVIVGTLLGVLFAPRKGKDLRKQLKEEVEQGGMGTETLKKNFTEMGQDMASTAEDIYHRPEVQKQVKKGKKHVDKIMRHAESKVNDAENVVKGMSKKYLDLDNDKAQAISGKIHNASQKFQKKLSDMRHKFMGDAGFTRKPISKSQDTGAPKSRKPAMKKKSKSRSKKVNIKKRS